MRRMGWGGGEEYMWAIRHLGGKNIGVLKVRWHS